MQVKADEQAAKAAADYAQAQAEAQAELHRQLQQRLADAQAAAAAQEAEKEKRRAQPVTLKGARLAFNAPKAPGKPAAAPPAGKHTSSTCTVPLNLVAEYTGLGRAIVKRST